jgi:autotransporter-associated beta strand protein
LGSNSLTLTGGGSFSGTISGEGSLIKSVFLTGPTTLTLTGASSFTGGVLITFGTIAVPDFGNEGVDGPLGRGPLTVNGGVIAFSATGSTVANRPLTIGTTGGGMTGGAGALTWSGLISGPGPLSVTGGTVVLDNPNNSFSGGITIVGGGTLSLADIPDNLPASVLGGIGPISFNAGRLRYTGSGSDSSDRPLVFGGGSTSTAEIEVVAGASLTLQSASGDGGFRKTGPGTLIFTNPNNSFGGDSTIGGGTLVSGPLAHATVPSALGRGAKIIFDGNGVLVLPSGGQISNRAIVVNDGGGRIKISNSTITLNGGITGNGPLTLAGDNPMTDIFIIPKPGIGRIIVDRATVGIASGYVLPLTASFELTNNTGSYLNLSTIPGMSSVGLWGGGGPNFGKVTLNGMPFNLGGEFDGIIEGGGRVTFKSGAVFTGTSTFGDILVDGGSLGVSEVANGGIPSPMGSGTSVQLGNGNSAGTFNFIGSGTDATNRSLLLTGSGGHIGVSDQNGTLVWTGPINSANISSNPGTMTITKEGPGTLRLTGSNSYVGSTLVQAGKLQVLGSNALPNFGEVVVLAGASLELLAGTNETIGSLEGSGALILGGQRLVTGGNELASTFSGVVSGSGGSQIEKQGGGTFTLTNPGSSFSGGVTIADGAVSVPSLADAGTNSPLGSNGPITLGDSTHTGRLVVTNTGNVSTNRPILVSQGGGIIEVSNDNAEVTLSGSISGSASFLKFGAGRLTFSGDKAYAGSLIVADGTLQLDGNTPGTPITVLDPGTLESSGPSSRTIGALTLSGGTVSPGLPGAVGVLNTGDITLNSGRFAIDLLDGTATGLDSLNVTGAIEFTGPVILTIGLGFDPLDDVNIFRILVNDGTDVTTLQNGTSRFSFNGNVLEEGEHFLVYSNSISQIFEIRYGLTSEDNDIRLIAVPEPGVSIGFALGGMAVLLKRHRRRGRG